MIKTDIGVSMRIALTRIVIALSFFIPLDKCLASDVQDISGYHWSAMIYQGWTSHDNLRDTFLAHYHYAQETMTSIGVNYIVPHDNIIARLIEIIFSQFELAGSVSYRYGSANASPVYEFAPQIVGRWTHLPWNQYLYTTIALSDGVSYATSVPGPEYVDSTEGTARFLNYLGFEVTIAPPHHHRLQLMFLIHHRSGCYGLYAPGITGSNVIGGGLRYYF